MQAVSNYMLSELIRLHAVMKCTLCDKVASLTHPAGGHESHWGFNWPTLSRVQKRYDTFGIGLEAIILYKDCDTKI